MDLSELSLAFVTLVFATYVLVSLVLRGDLRLGPGAVTGFALAQLAWLSICGALAHSGYLVGDVMALPPRIMRVVLGPALLLVIVSAALPATGRALDAARGDWLVSAQAFRIPVELILHGLFLAEALPRRLTFAGSNFDILSGLLALPLGYLMHKGRAPRAAIWAYNLLGLALLAIIVTLALLSAPTPLQVFDDGPTLTLPFHVPFVWLPGYLVPVALWLHLMSLRKLWRSRGPATSDGQHAAALDG